MSHLSLRMIQKWMEFRNSPKLWWTKLRGFQAGTVIKSPAASLSSTPLSFWTSSSSSSSSSVNNFYEPANSWSESPVIHSQKMPVFILIWPLLKLSIRMKFDDHFPKDHAWNFDADLSGICISSMVGETYCKKCVQHDSRNQPRKDRNKNFFSNKKKVPKVIATSSMDSIFIYISLIFMVNSR